MPSADEWNYILLDGVVCSDGAGPTGNLVLEANNNLYGTALAAGAYGYVVVFQIVP